jgi:hypothetical protein
MKPKSLIFLAVLAFVSFKGFSQLYINSTGKVGINNSSPSYQLDISGNFRVSQTY